MLLCLGWQNDLYEAGKALSLISADWPVSNQNYSVCHQKRIQAASGTLQYQ